MPELRVALTAAGVMIGGVLAGFAGYRTWQAHQAPELQLQLQAATRADGLRPETDGASDRPAHGAVPEQIPALTLPDLTGHPRALRDFLGRPLIINFWATWCAPCRREIPLLQALRRNHQGERLEVVGIAVDFREAVSQFVANTPIDYPLLIGEDRGMIVAEDFGMDPVLPFSVFSDAQGQIIAVKVGELHRDEAELILSAMRAVAQGHETLPAARGRIADRLHELGIQRAREAVNEPSP